MLTKCCVVNKLGKFGAKMFLHYTDIVIFMLGYFNLAHTVEYDFVLVDNYCSCTVSQRMCAC